MSRRARILLIGYRKFSELINAVVPEYEDDAEVVIVESLASGSVDYRRLVQEHDPDVVASAGSNAQYLAKTIKLPVIAQPVTDADVVEALARARRIGRRVQMFTYAAQPELSPRIFPAVLDLAGEEVGHHQYSTVDEAMEQLLAVVAAGEADVVVGPSYVCHLAEERGLASVLIYSKDSARRMLDEALARAQTRVDVSEDGEERTPFVIHSPTMARVATLARTYARGSAAVLVQGESGTGKEHIAREIHRASNYRKGNLVAINCGSIPNELFESELFGYVDGAFTSARRGGRMGLVEQANGGVLYLDEGGEMPLPQQVKLLRVLQERRVRPVGSTREIPLDFKIIAATNVDLQEAVDRGEFRDDLYYRLNVFTLSLPPLRGRREDIAALGAHYLGRYAKEYGVTVNVDALLDYLAAPFEAYRWPGNVRELQNFCERLVVNLAAGALPADLSITDVLPELAAERQRPVDSVGRLKDQEYRAIADAMDRLGGDKAAVSQELGISATTLWRRLKEMNWNASGGNGRSSKEKQQSRSQE